MTWAALFFLTLVGVVGTWAALWFRSRNNPASTAGLAGWWLLAGVGGLIVVGAWVGLLWTLRAR